MDEEICIVHKGGGGTTMMTKFIHIISKIKLIAPENQFKGGIFREYEAWHVKLNIDILKRCIIHS